MVDQVNVYVKNNLADTIRAIRYCLPGDNSELDISIASENEEMILLVRSQTYLVIRPPSGVYTADCLFRVSNEELLSWSTMDDHWTVEIKSNVLTRDLPTTVNVEVGDPGSG